MFQITLGLGMYFLFLLPSLLVIVYADVGCFKQTPNHALAAASLSTPVRSSVEMCARMCLMKMQCRSFVYFRRGSVCVLNRGDKNSMSENFVASKEHVDYYHRVCTGTLLAIPVIRERRKDDPVPDACFDVAKGRVLIGIVDQLLDDVTSMQACQKACLQAKANGDVLCKSAMYYPKEKECILASQNKADIQELYIEDVNAFYMENKCLDGSVKHKQPTLALDNDKVKRIRKKVFSVSKSSSSAPPSPSPTTTLATVAPNAPAMTDEDRESMEELAGTPDGNGIGQSPGTSPSGAFNLARAEGTTYTDASSEATELTTKASIEQSGYESPGEDAGLVGTMNTDDLATSTSTTKPKLVPTVDPKIVDSYAVEAKKEEAPYRKRMRDVGGKSCFNEIFPAEPLKGDRVMKAYSAEQCVDICRLCRRCIGGQRCRTVAYDTKRENCAVSSEVVENTGIPPIKEHIVTLSRSNHC